MVARLAGMPADVRNFVLRKNLLCAIISKIAAARKEFIAGGGFALRQPGVSARCKIFKGLKNALMRGV